MKEVNKIQKNEEQETLKAWQRYLIVKASWPAIVEQNIFDRVQNVLEENKKCERARLTNAEHRVFLFTGMTFCPDCGRSMTGQSAHGERSLYRYYGHVQNRGEDFNCKLKRIIADDLEQAVISHLGRILHRAGYFEGVAKNIKDSYATNGDQVEVQIKLVEKTIGELDLEIRGAFKIQAAVDSASESFKLAVESMEQLAKQKRNLSERLECLMEQSGEESGLLQSLDVLRDYLQEFNRGWAKLTVAQQKRLLRRTIVRLEVHPNMVGINFLLADGRLGFMPIDSGVQATNISAIDASQNVILPFKTKKPAESNLSVQNLRVVNSGEGCPRVVEHQELTVTRWYQIEWRRQVVDLTELAKRRWIDKIKIDELAQEFGLGTTQIKLYIRRIKGNPDAVEPTLCKLLKRSKAFRSSGGDT